MTTVNPEHMTDELLAKANILLHETILEMERNRQVDVALKLLGRRMAVKREILKRQSASRDVRLTR